MTYNARFEKVLPMINIADRFLIEESAYHTVGEDWLAYAKHTLDLAFKENTEFKMLRDAAKIKGSLLSLGAKAKNLLGLGEAVTPILGYEELIDIYYNDKRKVHGMGIKAIVDRFFGFQWSRQKLLYPLNKIPQGYQRPENWNEMIQQSELSQMLTVWFKQKAKSQKLAQRVNFPL